jgi:hypothetical protein
MGSKRSREGITEASLGATISTFTRSSWDSLPDG